MNTQQQVEGSTSRAGKAVAMAVVSGSRTQIGVKEFGGDVDVPYEDTAQLMYYLNCMCVVLDLKGEAGLTRLRDYKNYQRLSEGEKAALLVLCIALNPLELTNKCIFLVPEIRGGYPNQFLELSATRTNFVACSNVMVGGRSRQVTSIMLYTREWIYQCYFNPLESLTEGGGRVQQPPQRQAIQDRETQRREAEQRAARQREAERREAQRRREEEERRRNSSRCILQ